MDSEGGISVGVKSRNVVITNNSKLKRSVPITAPLPRACKAAVTRSRRPIDSVDAPQFIRLDFEQKLDRATRLGGEERTAKIESMTREEGKLILQGVQLGLGWSMVITQESGAMVLIAAGEQVAFVIFGACTPL